MTPKEAFRRIEINLSNYLGEGLVNERRIIKQALTELEELKCYPTSEEVCEALSKNWGNPVRYDERHSLFEMYVGDNTWKPVELLRMRTVKPSLITLIGRFYEGLEK